MLKEEFTDKRLIRMSSKSSLGHLLIKLSLQLEIQFFVKNAKPVLTSTVKLKSQNQLKEMNSKLGLVNFVTQKMRLNLKRYIHNVKNQQLYEQMKPEIKWILNTIKKLKHWMIL